jgi:hypothetical protein
MMGIMIKASVGVGAESDAFKAGVEAATQAISSIVPEQKADLLLVFGSISLDQDQMIAGVASVAQGALIAGCSTAGEISGEGFSTEKSVVVLALASDQVKFFGALANHIPWNPKQAGNDCANTLEYESHGYITSALVFLDILSGSGDLTLEGFTKRVGEDFPVFGGAAGDNMLFFETFQYFQDKAYKGSIVGVGIAGDYHAVGVVRHGFLPVGVARVVTRSEGMTLHELDGKPALSLYEDYFGEEYMGELQGGLLPQLAIAYPLGVFLPDSDEVLLRNPVFVDRKGAMTFTASIPEGAEVRLMISDVERSFETTESTAREVLGRLEGRPPKAVLVVNSIGRKKMLGSQNDEDIRIIQKIFGRDVPIVGFYSYAQVGGKVASATPFHNGSLLIWALAE